jgi:hypothetical protein
MVAVDLDGTLLNSEKQITEATAAVLRDVIAEGLDVVLATARPPRSVMPFYSLLDLHTPMINYNGALVYQPRETRIVMHRPLPAEISTRVVHLARRLVPDVAVSAEVLDKWYTDKLDQRYLTETALTHQPDHVADIETFLSRPITKLLLLSEQDNIIRIHQEIETELPHQVTTIHMDANLLQVMNITASKVQALRAVASELQVKRQAVMAIGDNANDVGMLQWAGIGVAMGNAAQCAKAAADMVTDHNDAEGVARAIHRVINEGFHPAR